jgi:hypothetical protein
VAEEEPGSGADVAPRETEPSRDPDNSRARLALITAWLGVTAALLTVIGALLTLLLH